MQEIYNAIVQSHNKVMPALDDLISSSDTIEGELAFLIFMSFVFVLCLASLGSLIRRHARAAAASATTRDAEWECRFRNTIVAMGATLAEMERQNREIRGILQSISNATTYTAKQTPPRQQQP